MTKLSLLAIAATALLAPGICYAQAYPSKPIRLIVSSTAGGAPDIAARGLAIELSKPMGQ